MTTPLQSRPSNPNSLFSQKVTYKEFLEAADGVWAEWVDGEVILLSPASRKHQDMVDFLTATLRHYAEAQQLGEVISAPFQMKTGADLPGREPDVLFVAQEHLARLRDTYLDGPADLVVEVISPESLVRDRGEKFSEYERGGVREYWLIDSIRQLAEFYRLENGVYHLAPVGEDGIYRSEVMPGLWLRLEWLWKEPLPPLMSVLKAWELV